MCSSDLQRRSQGRVVVEDAGPLFVDAVGGHQRGVLFVAMTDDLEQAVGAELVDRQMAEFIDAKERWFDISGGVSALTETYGILQKWP